MVAAASTALSSAQIADESGKAEEPLPAASRPSPTTQQPVPDAAAGVGNGSHTAEHSGGEAAETPASPIVADTATPAAAPGAGHAPVSVAEPEQPAKPAPYAFSGASSCRNGARRHKRACTCVQGWCMYRVVWAATGQPPSAALLQACNAFWTRHLHPCVRWHLGALTPRCWHLAPMTASCGSQGSTSRRHLSCMCADETAHAWRYVNPDHGWCRFE